MTDYFLHLKIIATFDITVALRWALKKNQIGGYVNRTTARFLLAIRSQNIQFLNSGFNIWYFYMYSWARKLLKQSALAFYLFLIFGLFFLDSVHLFGIESSGSQTGYRILYRLQNKQVYAFSCHFSEGTITFMQNKLIPLNFGFIIYIYIWINFKKDYSITYLLEKKIIHEKI